MLDNAILTRGGFGVRGGREATGGYCRCTVLLYSYLFWAISDFYIRARTGILCMGFKPTLREDPPPTSSMLEGKGGKIASETLNYVACDGREGREDYPDYWDEVCSKSSVPTPRMHGFQLMVFLTLVVQ